jgi:hypothetical protein
MQDEVQNVTVETENKGGSEHVVFDVTFSNFLPLRPVDHSVTNSATPPATIVDVSLRAQGKGGYTFALDIDIIALAHQMAANKVSQAALAVLPNGAQLPSNLAVVPSSLMAMNLPENMKLFLQIDSAGSFCGLAIPFSSLDSVGALASKFKSSEFTQTVIHDIPFSIGVFVSATADESGVAIFADFTKVITAQHLQLLGAASPATALTAAPGSVLHPVSPSAKPIASSSH